MVAETANECDVVRQSKRELSAAEKALMVMGTWDEIYGSVKQQQSWEVQALYAVLEMLLLLMPPEE